MKRSILYALAFLMVLILIGMFFPVVGSRSAGKKVLCRLEESDLNRALLQYGKDIGNYPTGENSNIVRILSGDNPPKTRSLSFRRTPEHQNEIVDPWETPCKIEFSHQTNFVIRSAGKNKVFGAAADIIFNSRSNDFVKP